MIDEYALWVIGQSTMLDPPLCIAQPFLARVMSNFGR